MQDQAALYTSLGGLGVIRVMGAAGMLGPTWVTRWQDDLQDTLDQLVEHYSENEILHSHSTRT